MPEYRKLEFELPGDLKPLRGAREFTSRNGNSLHNGLPLREELRYFAFMGYHALWVLIPMAGAFAALVYAMR